VALDGADAAGALLAGMLGLCESRPSLAQPLRRTRPRLDGKTLTLAVPPDFVGFATLHADDYGALAKKASGHGLTIAIEAGEAAEEAAAEPSADEIRHRRLREEAEKEPAVQEALDLFDGRVVDVREAKPSREDA
jgi:hypothetical protein